MHSPVLLSRWFPPPLWLVMGGSRRRLLPLTWSDLACLEDRADGSLLSWLQTPLGQRQTLAVSLQIPDAPATVLDRWFHAFTSEADLSRRWAAVLGVPSGDFTAWELLAKHSAPLADTASQPWETVLSSALALTGVSLEELGKCTVGQTATLLGVVPTDAARRWMTPAEARRFVTCRRLAGCVAAANDASMEDSIEAALQRGLNAWCTLGQTMAASCEALVPATPVLRDPSSIRRPAFVGGTGAKQRPGSGVFPGDRPNPAFAGQGTLRRNISTGRPNTARQRTMARTLLRLEEQTAELRRDLRLLATRPAPALFAES